MKKTMRGFGIGLFLAAACWTAYAQWLAPTSDEQIALLEQQLKDSEQKVKHLQQQVDAAQTTTTQNNSAQQAETSQEQPNVDAPTTDTASDEESSTEDPSSESAAKIDVSVVKGSILIYEDVTLYDIGKQAEDTGIIENGRELELYLYKPEYSRSIQKGQFELSSDMTLEEMALILTGKTKQ